MEFALLPSSGQSNKYTLHHLEPPRKLHWASWERGTLIQQKHRQDSTKYNFQFVWKWNAKTKMNRKCGMDFQVKTVNSLLAVFGLCLGWFFCVFCLFFFLRCSLSNIIEFHWSGNFRFGVFFHCALSPGDKQPLVRMPSTCGTQHRSVAVFKKTV